MRKSKFNIGDRVQLLPKSPQMKVVGQTKGGQVHCCWFDKDGKERRSTFPAAALDPGQDEPDMPKVTFVLPPKRQMEKIENG
jgi:uncharacterized protein YodC (DUF2158 family)